MRWKRRSVENFPLALFKGVTFQTDEIECYPGYLIAMVTDGLTEIFDKSGCELGLDYIERILLESASLPLAEIANRIFRSAERFGEIIDDQTFLLLRRA
jgi:serine phosphatase RsbU (regulator of sigma subunit)